jgi:peroxiredoxin
MRKLRPGAVISARELKTIRSKRIQLPDPAGVVHLQFRRYAGCPFCNLHLRSIVQRHQELVAAGIREVVVFQSSSAELLTHQGDVPFAVVADPARRLYAEFRVGSSPRAVLDPRAWLAGVRAVTGKRPSLPASRQQALGLPADFLVAADGHVLACKYGVHAYDQWSVDDLLQLAGHHTQPTDHRLRT